jgi:hypothetical protein
MNQPDRILTILDPPAGGWERLRARLDSARYWAPSWWALASGGAAAAAWLVIAAGHTEIRMPLSGGRLIDERSQGVNVQILENGHAVALQNTDPNVRMYWVEPPDSADTKTR